MYETGAYFNVAGGTYTPPWTNGYAPYPAPAELCARPREFVEDEDDENGFTEPAPRRSARGWPLIFGFVGLCAVVLYSVVSGRISVLSHPLNYHGLACGWDEPVRHLPYVYYPLDPKDGRKPQLLATRPMCVQRCPDVTDVEKKAYISISEASAVNVGKSLALLSVLHSVRSPVYASTPNYTSYCVPSAPALETQFQSIVSAENHAQSLPRSVAATLIAGVPSAIVAAILSTLVSHVAGWNAVFVPQAASHKAFLLSTIILFLSGLQSLMWYGRRWQCLLCMAAAVGFAGLWVSNKEQVTLGEELMRSLTPILEQPNRAFGLMVGLHCVMLSVIYFMLIAFCFLQTSSRVEEGVPLDFALDPNGGLKIYPLELISSESTQDVFWRYAQTVFVLVMGVISLEVIFNFHRSLCVMATYFKISTSDEAEDDSAPLESEFELLAVRRTFDNLGPISVDAMHKLVYRLSFPLLWVLRNHPEPPTWTESLEQLGHNGALLQFLLDVANETEGEATSYAASAEKAFRRRAAGPSPCREALTCSEAASLGPKLCAYAVLFAAVNSILLVVDSISSGRTARSPFVTTLLVTSLFAYVANLGISSAAAAAEAALFTAELGCDNKFSLLAQTAAAEARPTARTNVPIR